MQIAFGRVRRKTSPTVFADAGGWECRSHLGEYAAKPRLPGGVRCLAKTFAFFHRMCYDVSGVGRMYQFPLQCLRLDAHTVVDSFRGFFVPLLLMPLKGM